MRIKLTASGIIAISWVRRQRAGERLQHAMTRDGRRRRRRRHLAALSPPDEC